MTPNESALPPREPWSHDRDESHLRVAMFDERMRRITGERVVIDPAEQAMVPPWVIRGVDMLSVYDAAIEMSVKRGGRCRCEQANRLPPPSPSGQHWVGCAEAVLMVVRGQPVTIEGQNVEARVVRRLLDLAELLYDDEYARREL